VKTQEQHVQGLNRYDQYGLPNACAQYTPISLSGSTAKAPPMTTKTSWRYVRARTEPDSFSAHSRVKADYKYLVYQLS
jgi:hypothetical protein